MTIASTVNRNDYVGNGATSVYPYTYRIFSDTDLLVTKRDTDGIETTLALTTDYTVSGAGDLSGGSITLVAGALTSDYALTIRRVRPLTQNTDIRNQGVYFPEIHEDSFDHVVMLAQQETNDIARALKLPETEVPTALTTVIPEATLRANKMLGFDADGNVTALSTLPDTVTVTAYAELLLAAVNAAAARTVLGFGTSGAFIVNGDIANGTISAAKMASGVVFDSSVKTVFYQASAPTGWTAVAVNDKFLRVVTAGGTGGTTGGTVAASTSLAHTHTIAHKHALPFDDGFFGVTGAYWLGGATYGRVISSGVSFQFSLTTGGAGPTSTGRLLSDTTDTANSGSTFGGAFAYADIIIATKD